MKMKILPSLPATAKLCAALLTLGALRASAGWRELLWRDGDPHPDFAGDRHSIVSPPIILEDGTVIYRGTLTPNPQPPTGGRIGFFYVRPGELPQPLGGSGVFEAVVQVLAGPGSEIVAVTWPRVGSGSAQGSIRKGTVQVLGAPIFTGGSVPTSSDTPQLQQFYGGNRLAFTNGARVYRWLGGAPALIHGPEIPLPGIPQATVAQTFVLHHMAADGRALVWSSLYRGGFPVGVGRWFIGNDGVPQVAQLSTGSFQNVAAVRNFPPDPTRTGWGLNVEPNSGNSAGLYGPFGHRVDLSGGPPEELLVVRSIEGQPQILADPGTRGGAGFTWLQTNVGQNTQMGASGELFGRGTAVFLTAPLQRRMTAFFENGTWVPVVTEGDSLPGLPAGVKVGGKHRQVLENGGWFLFHSNLTGTGVVAANDAAWWIGHKSGVDYTFDLLMRKGDAISLPSGGSGPFISSAPADDTFTADIDQGPDSGRRRTMTGSGWLAQGLGTSTAAGLFLLGPSGQPPWIVSPAWQSYATGIFGADVVSEKAKAVTVWGVLVDADSDGLPNSIENYFGTSPLKASASPLLISREEASAILNWPVSATTIATAVPQWSPDLSTWLSSGESLNGIPARTLTVSAPSADRHQAVLSTSGLTVVYLRLLVALP